jgi:hypothetical protein
MQTGHIQNPAFQTVKRMNDKKYGIFAAHSHTLSEKFRAVYSVYRGEKINDQTGFRPRRDSDDPAVRRDIKKFRQFCRSVPYFGTFENCIPASEKINVRGGERSVFPMQFGIIAKINLRPKIQSLSSRSFSAPVSSSSLSSRTPLCLIEQ